MSENIYSPENILKALNIVENELIMLVGKDWPEIATKYSELKQALTDDRGKLLASVEVIELFSPFEAARERINVAILRQDELGDIMLAIADITRRMNLDPKISMAFAEAAQPSSNMRHVVISNIDEAKSFKLGNIQFDLGEMHIFGTAIMAIIAEKFVGKDVSPFIIAVGILSIAQKLIEKMTVEFDEREATVFYGFSQIVEDDKAASESAIRKATNIEREKIGLAPLDKIQLRNTLHQLEKLKTVELVEDKGDTWCIIERFRVKK
jgi:hypothetical protein